MGVRLRPKPSAVFDAQDFYNRIGKHYDWFEIFESQAKTQARHWLERAPGGRLLNVGIGTGKEHGRIQALFDGPAFGLDLSFTMASLAGQRTGAPLCQADARFLPYASHSFDVLYTAYVLDLIPSGEIPGILAEFHRVLKPGGCLLVLALTEGVTLPSRALVAAWKTAYAISPLTCGGCRPLQLSNLVETAGFLQIDRQVIVQLGVPSEAIIAQKKDLAFSTLV